MAEEHHEQAEQRLAEFARMNRALRVYVAINQALLHAKTETELIRQTCVTAAAVGGYRMVWVGFAVHDTGKTVQPICHAGYEAGYLTVIRVSWGETALGHGPVGTAIRTGQPAFFRDIAADPEMLPWRAEALQRGYRAVIALPLHINGTVIGALTLYRDAPEELPAEELHLLTEVAENLSYGIQALRTRQRQQHVEAALRESESRFRLLAERSTDMISRHTPQGVYLYVSPACRTLLGYDPEELVGHSAYELFHPDDLAMIRQSHRTMLEQPDVTTITYRIRRKDGVYIWFETTSHTIRDGTGAVIEIQTASRDVTARKKTEAALRESEEQFRALFQRSPVPMAIYRASGEIEQINDRFVAIFGYTQADLANITDWWPLAYPDEQYRHEVMAIWQQEVEKAERTGKDIAPREYRITCKDGTVRTVEISATKIGDRNLAIWNDITERKLAEQSVARERTFLDTAIELLPFPIFFITQESEILRQNRASQGLLHTQQREAWWGMPLLDPQTHMPISEAQRPFMRAIHGETTASSEYILVLLDGREMPILLHASPIYLDGTFVAAVIAFQDISALKETDRAKNQFLMVLSHEVKTPLTSIIGWAQMAQSAPDIVPEALGVILRNAYEQKAMIERLLILSNILTGRLAVQCVTFDLWTLVEECVDRVREEAQTRQITLRLTPPPTPLPVQLDRKLLRQALCEVIDNALRFTEAGGVITLSAAATDGEVHLVVQDTGRGIDPAQLPTLGTPFQQLQREERKGGLGIGLAVVRGIVTAHHGHFTLTSPGLTHGATATLTLPRQCVSTPVKG